MLEPWGSTNQRNLKTRIRPAPGESFGKERLAGSGAAGAKYATIGVGDVDHPHLVFRKLVDTLADIVDLVGTNSSCDCFRDLRSEVVL